MFPGRGIMSAPPPTRADLAALDALIAVRPALAPYQVDGRAELVHDLERAEWQASDNALQDGFDPDNLTRSQASALYFGADASVARAL